MIKLKVRYKQNNGEYEYGVSQHYVKNSLTAATVYFGNHKYTTIAISSLEVELPSGEWKDFTQALKDKDIINDSYGTYFDIPHSEKEKIQGWNYF